MGIALEIAFNGVAPSDALRANIESHLERLEKIAPDALSCRVAVRFSGHRHRKGNRYHVHAHLLIPGAELDAGSGAGEGGEYEDPYVAVRDAFDALRRQLENTIRRRQDKVKEPAGPMQGRISLMFLDSGYGIIETGDGREVRFHRNSVVDAPFHELEIGTEVRFTETPGADGPWAGTVQVLDRRTAVAS